MLLRAMRQIDALEGRLAAAMGVRSPATKDLQGQLQSTLTALEAQLTTSSASAFSPTLKVYIYHDPQGGSMPAPCSMNAVNVRFGAL